MFEKFVFLALGIVIGIMTGCSMKAGPVTGPPTSYCKDTRDGELFSFDIENVSNGRIHLSGGGCFDVIDNDGASRQLCTRHEQFIKCQAKPFRKSGDS